MIVYWDASAFILLYVQLPGRAAAERTWRGAKLNLLSKLAVLESLRALTALQARGEILRTDGRRAIEKLRADQTRLHSRNIDGVLHGPLLEKYIKLLERHWDLGTNDVLHLTFALAWKSDFKRSVTLATRDTRLAAAARKERLAVFVPRA